jgi:membrane protein required for colicin V production
VTFDLAALVVVLIFAVLGAFSGFARQVGQAVAAVAAFAASGPAGRLMGPWAARQLASSATVGVVVGSVVSFIVIYLVVRAIITMVLRRVLAGKNAENLGRDRFLGATLSAGKAASLIYLGLCAVTFLESNLVVSGKKFSIAPKDSVLVPLARRYNLLEYQQFPGAATLARALKAARDPQKAAALQSDPDFAALMKDPRFKGLVNQKGLSQALETGDLHALLSSNQVVELIGDASTLKRLERITDHE